MVKYVGINHLAMATKDMDTTIRFWRDLLGMRLVAGLGKPGYRQYVFEISDHDLITFFEWPDVDNMIEKDHGVPVKGPFAFDHVSFEVETEEDLWDLKNRLETADIWVSEVINHGFIHSIYSFDPNNIPIEFSVPVPGVDIRKHPRMKDEKPTAATQEGSEPQTDHWPKFSKPIPLEERIVYPGDGMALMGESDE
ncbi:MAG: VOC family protein [Thermodesulfobacteriota bacterium]|nr:VOC family protein [Thermodesulfobacteriota bacterium]